MPDSTPKDLLTPKTAAIILAPFAAAVIAGRMHPEIVAPITLTLTVLGAMWTVDRLEARRRMIVGTGATVLGCYTLAIIWPWAGPGINVPGSVVALAAGLIVGLSLARVGVWIAGGDAKAALVAGGIGLLLGLSAWPGIAQVIGNKSYAVGALSTVPLIVGVLAIWCIGSGHDKRTVPKATAYLPAVVDKHLPVGVTRDKPIIRGGKLSMVLKAGPSAPKGAMSDFDRKIASALSGTKRGAVKVIDLGAEMGEGYYRLEVGTTDDRFADAQRPPLEQWDGRVPLGGDANGGVVWLSSRLHAVVCGETGSGKSVTLTNIGEGKYALGYMLVLIDPKKVELHRFDGRPGCFYYDTPSTSTEALAWLVKMMNDRYAMMRQAKVDDWNAMPADKGPRIWCCIDESPELFDQAPDAEKHALTLFRLARAAGIELAIGVQYPTDKNIPQTIKQQAPVVICHRVRNETAMRAALGEKTGPEWNVANTGGTQIPNGRAVLDMPGHPRQWVQVFPKPEPPIIEMPPAQPAPPDQPTAPHAPYAGRSTVDPVDSVEVDSTRSTQPEPPSTALDLYAGKDTRTIILEALDNEPITGEALALIAQVSPQAVSKHMQKLLEDGLAKRARGGWVRA